MTEGGDCQEEELIMLHNILTFATIHFLSSNLVSFHSTPCKLQQVLDDENFKVIQPPPEIPTTNILSSLRLSRMSFAQCA